MTLGCLILQSFISAVVKIRSIALLRPEELFAIDSSLFGSNPPVRVGTWKTVPQVKLARSFASEDQFRLR